MTTSGEVGKELSKLNMGTELWVSEYNLTDRNYAIHGHWAHGLFVAALTLSFLSDERITHVNQFQMSSDAFHGNVFATENGFAGGPGYVSLHPELFTEVHEFTACGNAMQLVGRSLRNATAVSPLILTPENGAVIQPLADGYSSLVGYKILKPYADELIMLNLSEDSTALDVTELFGSDTVNFESLWWIGDALQRPLIEVTGDMPVVSGTFSNAQIYVPPYAILRLYKNKNHVYLQATDDTICEGTSTTIWPLVRNNIHGIHR
jgi:hypothetical protein